MALAKVEDYPVRGSLTEKEKLEAAIVLVTELEIPSGTNTEVTAILEKATALQQAGMELYGVKTMMEDRRSNNDPDFEKRVERLTGQTACVVAEYLAYLRTQPDSAKSNCYHTVVHPMLLTPFSGGRYFIKKDLEELKALDFLQ